MLFFICTSPSVRRTLLFRPSGDMEAVQLAPSAQRATANPCAPISRGTTCLPQGRISPVRPSIRPSARSPGQGARRLKESSRIMSPVSPPRPVIASRGFWLRGAARARSQARRKWRRARSPGRRRGALLIAPGPRPSFPARARGAPRLPVAGCRPPGGRVRGSRTLPHVAGRCRRCGNNRSKSVGRGGTSGTMIRSLKFLYSW